MSSFIELRDQVFVHYFEGQYQAALDLLEAFEPAGQSQDEDLRFWRMCIQSRLGETDRALATFAEALDAEHWWSETILEDSDLDPLRERPEWMALLRRSTDAEAQVPTPVAMPMVIPPPGPETGERRALVVLHGAGSRAELEAEYWRAATRDGWALVLPQSTQRLSAAGRYGWHDLERGQADVVEQLTESGWTPGCSVVLGGFSQGGGLAAHLVCAGIIGAEGLVVVSPTFGDWGVPAVADGRPVRSWILLGADEHPRIAVGVEELGETLQSSGWPMEIERLEGVGHAFPSDFEGRLARALIWVGASDLK